MSELISIIIPVYNAERTIERCLDSVLAQSHREIEVICINDASSDGSSDILSRYRAADSRVRVISPDTNEGARSGCGPATARNAGLDAAKGRYIGFVDADDFIAPLMYEKLLTAIEGSELANCGRVSFFPGGSEKTAMPDLAGTFTADSPDALGRLIAGVPDFIWDKLFVAAIIREKEIRFPDGRVYGEDTVFLIKYLCHVKRAVFLSEPLYHYNAHSEGSITNTISDRWYDIFENLKDIIYFMRETLDESSYRAVEPYLEELCIRYYDRRANAMIRHGERGFQIRYVKYSFEFLTYHFPGWKKRMVAMAGVVFPRVKTSILLMRLYILAPGFIKDRFAERLTK